MGVLGKFWGFILWVLREIKTLYHILFSPIKGKTHGERLESFYRLQAENYDSYRKRLLHGREQLFEVLYAHLKPGKGISWIDMGAGTGYNLECMNEYMQLGRGNFSKISLVDLSGSLLKQAEIRVRQHGWEELVEFVEEDAILYAKNRSEERDGKVDLVTFSYSLTMIPDWFSAAHNAWKLLKPGGIFAIVDFYVARKYPADDEKPQGWFTRTFWKTFFAFDNVRLSDDHIQFLRTFHPDATTLYKKEAKGSVPYIPLLKAPYYILLLEKGAKTQELS